MEKVNLFFPITFIVLGTLIFLTSTNRWFDAISGFYFGYGLRALIWENILY